MKEQQQAYYTKGNQVYFGDQFICSANPPNGEIDESREEGESWLDMRKRTEPLRENAEKLANEMAGSIAEHLNKTSFYTSMDSVVMRQEQSHEVRFRNKKTGNIYRQICISNSTATRHNWEIQMVYQDVKTGEIWSRKLRNFLEANELL